MNKFTIEVTDSSFDSDVLHSIRPVLVYFWADWCEECRYLSPIVGAVAESKRASLKVALLNVDENPRITRSCLIQMVPTMILFMLGEERERIEGVTNQTHLSSTIDMHIAAKCDDEMNDESDLVN